LVFDVAFASILALPTTTFSSYVARATMSPSTPVPFTHKNIRLYAPLYTGQKSYFITLCCAHRHHLFANPTRTEQLIERLRSISTIYRFSIYAYCVMPDHFHALVKGLEDASNLLRFIKNLKQITSDEYKKDHTGDLWQKKFYDHILRKHDRADAVAGYIWMNPVRARLCAAPQEYPYSGSFVLDWKKGLGPVESWIPEWKKRVEGKMAGKASAPAQKAAATKSKPQLDA
jgi:putative transposase